MKSHANKNACSTSYWLGLAILACLQSGCAMCTNDFDCFYGAYGGSVCRDDMTCGRVNSVIRPAGGHAVGPQSAAYPLEGEYPSDGQYLPEGTYNDAMEYGTPTEYDGNYLPGSGQFDNDSYIVPSPESGAPSTGRPSMGRPYDMLPGEPIPAAPTETMPPNGGAGVEATSYHLSQDEYDGGRYEYADDGSEMDAYGFDEEPVEVYEPDYGYDDAIVNDRSSSARRAYQPRGRPSRETDYNRQSHVPAVAIGSGISQIVEAPSTTQIPKSLPRRESSISSRMPDEAFIEKLLPLSEPPRPGFLSAPPRH